jgi:hypothetical protein
MPTAASIDERCAKVPVQLVLMRVRPALGGAPMVDRLALVGEPVSEVILRDFDQYLQKPVRLEKLVRDVQAR